jgi:hypothetical protein
VGGTASSRLMPLPFADVFRAIRELMTPTAFARKRIGFNK